MHVLTEQELHNLGMNIAGKKLQKMGYEFVAVNSTLKKHPQFVLFKKGEPTIFVLVKVTLSTWPASKNSLNLERLVFPGLLKSIPSVKS